MRSENCPQTLGSFLWNLCHVYPGKEQFGSKICIDDCVIAHFSTKAEIGPQQRRLIGHTATLGGVQCLKQRITAMKNGAPTGRRDMVVAIKIAKGRSMRGRALAFK